MERNTTLLKVLKKDKNKRRGKESSQDASGMRRVSDGISGADDVKIRKREKVM